jgi:type III pantothenate kinase
MDIGNTNIEIGVLPEKKGLFDVIASVRYYTRLDITSDQLGLFVINFLNVKKIDLDNIKGLIYSSVVPPLNNVIKKMFEDYFNENIIEVNENTKLGIKNCYKNPREVGSDRLVNAVACHYLYKKNCIIVDMGTATTICALTGKGEYLGGVIFAGINTSTQALTSKAARLPAIKIQKKDKILCEDTTSAIESGVYFSNYFALKGIIENLADEIKFRDYYKVGTGGLINIFDETGLFDKIENILTLKGLKIIYDLNI